jgi:hypothetical protein
VAVAFLQQLDRHAATVERVSAAPGGVRRGMTPHWASAHQSALPRSLSARTTPSLVRRFLQLLLVIDGQSAGRRRRNCGEGSSGRRARQIRAGKHRSFQFDVCSANHLPAPLGVFDHEFVELGRRGTLARPAIRTPGNDGERVAVVTASARGFPCLRDGRLRIIEGRLNPVADRRGCSSCFVSLSAQYA